MHILLLFSVNIYRYDNCHNRVFFFFFENLVVVTKVVLVNLITCHNRVKYEIIKCELCNTQIIKYANLTISVLIF